MAQPREHRDLSRREALALGGALAGSALLPCTALAQELNGSPWEADPVRTLEINWAAGSVTVTVDDTKADGAILVEEDTTPGFLGLRPPTTRCELSGTKLSIDYGGNFVFPFSLFQGGSKDLAVTLPSSLADHLDRLEINGASGSYTVDGAGCTELRVALASGRLTASNVQVDDLNLDMASGRLEVEGRIASTVSLEVASGTAALTCSETCPRDVAVDMASGHVTLAIPENDGFVATVEKLSGSFSTDFDVTQEDSDGRSVYRHKDGNSLVIDAEFASGNLKIIKA